MAQSNAVIIAFLVLDAIVTIGVVAWILSRRKNGSSTSSSAFPSASANAMGADSPWDALQSSSTTPANNEIQALLRRGQKIEAIKMYRERTGMDLKAAKDAVEAIHRQMQ